MREFDHRRSTRTGHDAEEFFDQKSGKNKYFNVHCIFSGRIGIIIQKTEGLQHFLWHGFPRRRDSTRVGTAQSFDTAAPGAKSSDWQAACIAGEPQGIEAIATFDESSDGGDPQGNWTAGKAAADARQLSHGQATQ